MPDKLPTRSYYKPYQRLAAAVVWRGFQDLHKLAQREHTLMEEPHQDFDLQRTRRQIAKLKAWLRDMDQPYQRYLELEPEQIEKGIVEMMCVTEESLI